MTTTQGIKLDDATRKRLKALGAARNRSAHWLMRAAIQDYLQREEKYEREKREDMEEWKRYKLDGKFVSHKSVEKWLSSLARGKAKKRPAR
jgi:predicted transcriptional regulator